MDKNAGKSTGYWFNPTTGKLLNHPEEGYEKFETTSEDYIFSGAEQDEVGQDKAGQDEAER